jgi:hypothetical protein
MLSISRPHYVCIQSVLSLVYLAVIHSDFEGHNHFLNYYGEDCARLFADETVHSWAYKPSPLMAILTPLLFFDCVTQVYELNRVFVDEVACTAQWNTCAAAGL